MWDKLKSIIQKIKTLWNGIHKQLKYFTILNMLDLILTYFILIDPPNPSVHELNPFYSSLFPYIGFLGSLLLLKTTLIIIYIKMVTHFCTDNEKIMNRAMIVINFAFVLIVINNLYWNLYEFI